MRQVRLLVLLMAGFLMLAPFASADLIAGTPIPLGNGLFAYPFHLTQNGTYYATGDFFVIYDTGQVSEVDLTQLQGTWDWAQNLTDPDLNLTDNAGVLNIRFTYTGTPNLTDPDLGTLVIKGPALPVDIVRGERSRRASIASVDSVIEVPEPAAITLIGGGLLGLAGVIRRKLYR